MWQRLTICIKTTPSHSKQQQQRWCSITHVAHSWLWLLFLFGLCLRLKTLPGRTSFTELPVPWWLSRLICLPRELFMCNQEPIKHTKSLDCFMWKQIIAWQNKKRTTDAQPKCQYVCVSFSFLISYFPTLFSVEFMAKVSSVYISVNNFKPNLVWDITGPVAVCNSNYDKD